MSINGRKDRVNATYVCVIQYMLYTHKCGVYDILCTYIDTCDIIYIYIKNFSAVNKNEIIKFTGKWMNLRRIILSDQS